MANSNDKSTAQTVAIVGGGALLLLLLLRGKGWGLGGKGDGASSTKEETATTAPPCQVRVDANGIQVDGARADIPTMTTRCRTSGSAEVRATGAAITHVIAEVVRALHTAGVRVWAGTDVWDAVDAVPVGGPR